MEQSSNKSQAHTQKLSVELKKAFPKLNDEEIGFQATKPDKFYEAVKNKQSINRDEAEKTVKKLDAECAAACASPDAPAARLPGSSPRSAWTRYCCT